MDKATKEDPYTNSRRTIGDTADGLYEAFRNKQKKLAGYLGLMKE